MKKNSKRWADIATSKQYKHSVDQWPDIKPEKKDKFNISNDVAVTTNKCSSKDINNLTENMVKLQLEVDETNTATAPTKSREEITAERKLRRKVKKIEKDQKRYEEKVAAIREPKTDKLKIVDQTVLDRYIQNQKQSATDDVNRSKSKHNKSFEVSLSELVNVQSSPISKSYIQKQQMVKPSPITQRNKGKKSEVKRKKYVSIMKRSILLAREQRKQIKNEEEKTDCDRVVEVTDCDRVVEVTDCDRVVEVTECEQSSVQVTSEQETEKIFEEKRNSSAIKFSRKFRPYCDNFTTPELCTLTEALLSDIFRFQDRAYKKNEIKGRSQRRYVVGFKETIRQLEIGKVKLLIIAPDLEPSTEDGGISETIEKMKTNCQNGNVPYLFSLKRRKLGYLLLKKVPISCVGILNYQGSEENSQKLLPLIESEKQIFKNKRLNDL